MKYTIILQQERIYQAEVEVEADSPEDAEDIGLEKANDDDFEEIDWTCSEAIKVIQHK
jgi:hypothetical protein